MLIKGRFLVSLLLSDMIRGFKMGARHVVKFPLCVFVVCISTLQDSSVSIFDQLSGLIADSLLWPPAQISGIIQLTLAHRQTRGGGGGSLPYFNWKQDRCQCSKESPHH